MRPIGVSSEEVAGEVGVIKPALYCHFPRGKGQVFVEIARCSLRCSREGMEHAVLGTDEGQPANGSP